MSMVFDDVDNLRIQVTELKLRQQTLLRAISAVLSSLDQDDKELESLVRKHSVRDTLMRSVLLEAVKKCEKSND